ncbi:Bax inhibitor-1/YccA family protein [Nocardioides okcheonensis]|uniref:Bax inhibitor-1/YccA family protein n=1 Tax=Nocardioides okcheonensis TaxID=2894081 RepID=UPI001E340878|nr:Bax inhibitor-1/YccA family protein [Nocardioides okcheonensis]UFN46269.1 Bax inhibitor-1/YccA family protein [Nocardioides okcheonensis]
MRSNNPVFARSEEFNRSSNAFGNQTYAGGGAAYPGYGETPGQVDQRRMTIDSVVQKTAISIALVFAAAFATWYVIGDVYTTDSFGRTVTDDAALGTATTLMIVGSGAAFLLSLVNSFKRVISPALVMAFALFEGVALGAISKFFDASFGDGIITQAVLGTFAAFAGTLAAYKFFDIKVGAKFRTFVMAGVLGMVGLGLLSLVLSFFGIQTGLFGFGALGLVMSFVGLALGVFMLILDFDFVENGVAAGLPERESWRAAFGLTVSLVWIYTNLLRILAILRGD